MISVSVAYSGAADPHPYLRSSARAAPGPAEPQRWTSGVSTSRPLQLLHTALQVLQAELLKSIASNNFCVMHNISMHLLYALVLSQVSASIHAEQPLSDVSHDAVWDATAQLPWSAAPRIG